MSPGEAIGEPGRAMPADGIAKVLQARAAALAKPLEQGRASAQEVELLVFSLAGERYALETSQVLEVLPLHGLTPVPCTPPVVLGVVNHRGRTLPVLDLRQVFGLASPQAAEGARVVAVEAGGVTVGIFAEGVTGMIRIGPHEVAPPPVGLPGGRDAFLRGVTGELIAVLDLEAVVKDPRVVVNDEAA